MKTRMFFMSLFFVFLANYVIAQDDFRKIQWGMDIMAVKASEKECPFIEESNDRLIFECPIIGIKSKIIYNFTLSKQLMRAKYYFNPDYYNVRFYLKDYKMFQELLTKKYGKSSKVKLSSSEVNPAEENWPFLLSTGNLRMETFWATPTTDIILTISKQDTKPVVQIDYISKEYTKKNNVEKGNAIYKKL